MTTKQCSSCKKTKSIADYTSVSNKFSLFIKDPKIMKTCESCRCKDKRYKEKNREVLNEKQKQNYIKSKEQRLNKKVES